MSIILIHMSKGNFDIIFDAFITDDLKVALKM
jgi:hypothetical protein